MMWWTGRVWQTLHTIDVPHSHLSPRLPALGCRGGRRAEVARRDRRFVESRVESSRDGYPSPLSSPSRLKSKVKPTLPGARAPLHACLPQSPCCHAYCC